MSALLARGWPPEHPKVVRAQGRTLWTEEGEELLDGASGALAATVGYGVAEVAEAVGRQARELAFAHSLHFTTAEAEAYGEELADAIRGESGHPLNRILLVPGGSEANEMALILARRIQALQGEPQRNLFLARHLSYHGSTLATISLGGRHSLRSPIEPLITPVAHLPPPYPYRPEWGERFPGSVAGVHGLADIFDGVLPEDALGRGRSDPVEAVAVALEALAGRVCAFVAEPIIGASGGAIVPPEDYWPRVQRICRKHGVLLIADEVLTGMGRTGDWLASHHWGLEPDILTLGKGLAGGYVPLGAVAVGEDHWQLLSREPPGFPFGFTFSQHPVAAAAGRSVLALLQDGNLPVRAEELGRRMRQGLADALRGHPHVGEVRGRGLLTGVELVLDTGGRRPFPTEWNATGRLLKAARNAGIVLYPARGGADGVSGDAFLLAPALTTTDDEAEVMVSAALLAVDRVTAEWEKAGPVGQAPPG